MKFAILVLSNVLFVIKYCYVPTFIHFFLYYLFLVVFSCYNTYLLLSVLFLPGECLPQVGVS